MNIYFLKQSAIYICVFDVCNIFLYVLVQFHFFGLCKAE